MVSAGTNLALTYRHQLDVEEVSQWCYAPGECVATEPVIPILLVLVTGFVTFLVAVTLLHVDDAWPLLQEERERTRAERDAFHEFARRVASLDASMPQAAVGSAGAVQALETAKPSLPLRRVEDAYRETVMAVPHYEEEYDEPLEVNMTAELGAEVAAAVSEGSTLTPQLKTALTRTGTEAVTQRDRLLQRLDREAAALEEAETDLRDIEVELDRLGGATEADGRFGRLLGVWSRLRELDDRCRAVLTERQEFVNDNSRGTDDIPSIQEYLYRPLDVNYPALAAGTALVERIDETRNEVEAAIARSH